MARVRREGKATGSKPCRKRLEVRQQEGAMDSGESSAGKKTWDINPQ